MSNEAIPELKTSKVPKTFQLTASKLVTNLVEKTSGIDAALITTEDGFLIAIESVEKMDSAKLAAMASSLSAIGNLSVAETNKGTRYHNIIIESDYGYILVMDVSHQSFPMILNIVASKKAVLGKIIHDAKEISDVFKGNKPNSDNII